MDGEAIWALKRRMREDLIVMTRAPAGGQQCQSRRWPRLSIPTWRPVLPQALSYDGLTLMLRDPARLKHCWVSERPIADRHRWQGPSSRRGRQSPGSGDGAVRRRPRGTRARSFFLPDYNMDKRLYPGCDVWMNNPLRPYMGMKAALNGAANLSIRDGWWDEWFESACAGRSSAEGADGADRDDLEAKALYDIIENEIVPRFYDLDQYGLPERWTSSATPSPGWLPRQLVASRMVRDYVTNLYTHASASTLALDSLDRWKQHALFASWKRKIRNAWSSVAVEHVKSARRRAVEEWAPKIHVSALVRLGKLAPDDIQVQLVTGRVSGDDRLLDHGESVPDWNQCRRRTTSLRRVGGGSACRRDRIHRARRSVPPAARQPGAVVARVSDHGVGVCPGPIGQLNLNRVRTGVEPEEVCLVGGSVRVVVREVHAKRATRFVAPVLLAHLGIPTAEPGNVLAPAWHALRIEQKFTLPEAVPPEDRLGTQLEQFARKFGLVAPSRLGIPMHP